MLMKYGYAHTSKTNQTDVKRYAAPLLLLLGRRPFFQINPYSTGRSDGNYDDPYQNCKYIVRFYMIADAGGLRCYRFTLSQKDKPGKTARLNDIGTVFNPTMFKHFNGSASVMHHSKFTRLAFGQGKGNTQFTLKRFCGTPLPGCRRRRAA